jgi:hypothetical protein
MFYYVSAKLGGSKHSILMCQTVISFTVCYTSITELGSVNLYWDDNRHNLHCNNPPSPVVENVKASVNISTWLFDV